MKTDALKDLAKPINDGFKHFMPHSRVLIGITLASIYFRDGKSAFVTNARFLAVKEAAIDAMLEELERESGSPTEDMGEFAPGYCKICGTPPPCRHGNEGFRGVQITRTLPVRDLTPEECRQLLVHCHSCGSERQRAYLYVASNAIADGKAGPELYFNEAERLEIKRWIENEDAKNITH